MSPGRLAPILPLCTTAAFRIELRPLPGVRMAAPISLIDVINRFIAADTITLPVFELEGIGGL